MKIAIHSVPLSFSDDWINYCKEHRISYKEVSCYSADIIQQINDCDVLMWHFNHANYKDVLFAKQLLISVESQGIKVFPNYNTCWHFDDKIGQKYLLEAINAPLVPTYIFYAKNEAISWIEKVDFPKVFKLSRGAGAVNVRLVHNKRSAKRLVNRAFGTGFSQFNRIGYFRERIRKFREGGSFYEVLKGFARLFIPIEFAKMHPNEKGYIYFQDFIPNNNFDIRVIVIENKAFAIKRMTRKNDFRASGSGHILYNKESIPLKCVKLAFEMNKKIKSQCIAYDFVFDLDGSPLVVEISYGYTNAPYKKCPGYWDEDLNWHEESFLSQYWVIENLIKDE